MAIVNWSQLWQQMLYETGRIEFCNPTYWDKEADAFNQNVEQMADLTEKQLERLNDLSGCTVLEVGAGTGRITVPIAKKAEHVTALEPSMKMMAFLKANAQKEHVNNIDYVNCSIEGLDAKVLKPHDVVVVSFSLFTLDIKAALLKINDAATKRVCIFASASEWLDKEIQNIIYDGGKAPSNFPDYVYLYNTLLNMGISARTDIWDFQYNQHYNDLAAAVAKFAQSYHVPTAKLSDLKAYLNQTLIPDTEGKLWLKRKRKAAMISWSKNS